MSDEGRARSAAAWRRRRVPMPFEYRILDNAIWDAAQLADAINELAAADWRLLGPVAVTPDGGYIATLERTRLADPPPPGPSLFGEAS